MKLIPAVLGCLLLVGCGSNGSSSAPDVDWSKVPQNQHAAIDDAVKANDCDQMQTYFDGSKRADVLAYIDWHLRKAGCYK